MNSSDESENDSWHSLPVTEVLDKLHTTSEGHSEVEAIKRFRETGPNSLAKKQLSPQRLFLNQLNKFLIIILLLAILLSNGL